MGHILVEARMPNGDDIKTRDLDRRLKHNQPAIVLAQQPRWNECHKIVRLQYLWQE